MSCQLCGGDEWITEYEEEVGGFVDIPCPECQWPRRPSAPIPAPVDALAFVSDSKRIALGEDEAWRQYAEEERR